MLPVLGEPPIAHHSRAHPTAFWEAAVHLALVLALGFVLASVVVLESAVLESECSWLKRSHSIPINPPADLLQAVRDQADGARRSISRGRPQSFRWNTSAPQRSSTLPAL
jgi:hypothetical protein